MPRVPADHRRDSAKSRSLSLSPVARRQDTHVGLVPHSIFHDCFEGQLFAAGRGNSLAAQHAEHAKHVEHGLIDPIAGEGHDSRRKRADSRTRRPR